MFWNFTCDKIESIIKLWRIQKMSEQVYKCESCGGIMEFDPNTQTLKCPNCDNSVIISGNRKDIVEHSFTGGVARTYSVKEKQSSTMMCKGCGATIEVSGDATAAICPYCGSSYVLSDKQEEAIIPDGVIPFQFDTNQVKLIFGKWIKKRYFAPNSLKHLYQEGKIQGRYIPFWTFDARCTGSYTGFGGKNRTETYKDSDGNEHTKTETDWYPTSGPINHFFDDVLISGTKNFRSSLVSGMGTYNTKALEGYKPEYFSGYLSETYTVDLNTAHREAVSDMDSELREIARKDILRRYDEARDIRLNVRYNDETFKHIMVPVYATSFFFKNKNYTVLINGQNGTIKGEYPKSPAKIIALIVVIIAALVALWAFLNRNNDSFFADNTQYESAYEIVAEGDYSEVEYSESDYTEVDYSVCDYSEVRM